MGIACVVGAVFGSFGIQNIINYVTPIFLIMYPICIVLTVLGLVDKWIPNDGVYKFGVAVAGIVGVGDAILAVAPNLDGLRKAMYMIPLAEQGFSWLIPTVIAMVIGGIVYRGKPRYNYGETAVATEEGCQVIYSSPTPHLKRFPAAIPQGTFSCRRGTSNGVLPYEKISTSTLQRPMVICLLAAFCCLLWGSAFPAVKIGYGLLSISSADSAEQLIFAGLRFFFAGVVTVLFPQRFPASAAASRTLLPVEVHEAGPDPDPRAVCPVLYRHGAHLRRQGLRPDGGPRVLRHFDLRQAVSL